METASTGRTHDCTRPTCINVKTNLANREPSTHGLPTSSPASRPRSPPWRWPTRTPAPPGHCCTMAEPIAGPRRSRRRATKTRSSRVWQGEREVMQNRSNRGSGKPVWVRAHQAREFDWDPIRRIALGPAVMETASTGRTHDCTRPTCINVKTNLANREPSTHEVMQNRSNRGSGKPVWVRAHQAREFDWDPIRRIALGPAVMETASTGRTHDCTRPTCINVKTNLANREPSTHGLPTSSPASRPRSPPWRWPTRTPAPPGHCCTMAEPIAGPRRSRRRATEKQGVLEFGRVNVR